MFLPNRRRILTSRKEPKIVMFLGQRRRKYPQEVEGLEKAVVAKTMYARRVQDRAQEQKVSEAVSSRGHCKRQLVQQPKIVVW